MCIICINDELFQLYGSIRKRTASPQQRAVLIKNALTKLDDDHGDTQTELDKDVKDHWTKVLKNEQYELARLL